MLNKRKGILTDTVKPIGMRNPFNIEVTCDVHIIFQQVFLRLQVIKNKAFVYPVYRNFPSFENVEKFFAFLYQFSNANRLYAQVFLRAIKVDAGLLFVWFYFKQNGILNRYIICDHFL